MSGCHDPALSRLLVHFTPDELAVLTEDELRLLAALEDEELPDVSQGDERQAADDYRARVLKKLAMLPPG